VSVTAPPDPVPPTSRVDCPVAVASMDRSSIVWLAPSKIITSPAAVRFIALPDRLMPFVMVMVPLWLKFRFDPVNVRSFSVPLIKLNSLGELRVTVAPVVPPESVPPSSSKTPDDTVNPPTVRVPAVSLTVAFDEPMERLSTAILLLTDTVYALLPGSEMVAR
jgi:hypothetical protein